MPALLICMMVNHISMGDDSTFDLFTGGMGPRTARLGAMLILIVAVIFVFATISGIGWLEALTGYLIENPMLLFTIAGFCIIGLWIIWAYSKVEQ